MGGIDREKLKDPNYKGDDFEMDQEIENGPKVDRGCTDILCCFVFLAFTFGMVVIAIYGWSKGNPTKLLSPIESGGRFCGHDSAVKDYPYLYFADLSDLPNSLKKTVCAKACPATGSDTVDCVTNDVVSTCTASPGYATELYLDRYCFPVKDELPTQYAEAYDDIVEETGLDAVGEAIADLDHAKWVILIDVFIAFALGVFYMFFVKHCAKVLAWVSIIGCLFLIIGLGAYFWWKAGTYPENTKNRSELKTWAIIAWVCAALYLIILLCICNQLALALAILEAAAEYVNDAWRALLVPIFGFFVIVLFYVVWIVVAVFVYSVGEITTKEVGGIQYASVKWEDSTRYAWYYTFFGALWYNALIIAIGQFMIIVSCSYWYFSVNSDQKDISVTRGLGWAFRYHGGSLAFGSLILAIVWMIKIMFEYMRKKLDGKVAGEAGKLMDFFICLCRCCIDCLNRCIKFINRNAYIQIALTGDNFCVAAYNAFMLIL